MEIFLDVNTLEAMRCIRLVDDFSHAFGEKIDLFPAIENFIIE